MSCDGVGDHETLIVYKCLLKRVKGSVGEGEAGKKVKTTQHTGEQSVSQKSQVT